MSAREKTLRTCPKGHRYYKSSDCPTCPVCEEEKKPNEGFLSLLSAPARRALESHGIHSLQQLSGLSKRDLLKLHGFGPASIPILEKALRDKGLAFRKE